MLKGDPCDSHFANQPFNIDDFVPANQKTRDLVHRSYEEQVQIDGGKMDKFVAVSDANGLAIGVGETTNVPLAAEVAVP